ncbi:hypothetical protein OG21DRAFT_1515418 [Imleria badia]|nr:hypothetical protein OG21DRAFT_1515418 [Imleria badia]
MAPSTLSLITIVLSLSQVSGALPSSNATCQPEYTWMDNVGQLNPCLTVAYVIAACDGDTWTQPALPSGYSYDSPNGTTATPCYCSWSCYNLMMGCTLCQNSAYTSDTKTWPSFSENCPSNYKDEMFPQGYVLANNASIPYWATINPTKWPSELFDIEQAQSYANQNQSDYWPSNSSPSSSASSTSSGSSTNLGAIIGGTVGGAAGLLLVLVGGYIIYKRRRYQRLANTDGVAPFPHMGTPMASAHTRWPSDPSPFFPSTASTSYSPFQPSSATPPTESISFLTTGNNVAQCTRAIPMV